MYGYGGNIMRVQGSDISMYCIYELIEGGIDFGSTAKDQTPENSQSTHNKNTPLCICKKECLRYFFRQL